VPNRRAELLLLCLALPLLSACFGGSKACVDPDDEPYLRARNNPPLRTPEGLTTPDRSAALAIPASSPDASAARPSGSGCLAEPPSYFRSAGTVARSPEEVVASFGANSLNKELTLVRESGSWRIAAEKVVEVK
jgi:hypothetical protein